MLELLGISRSFGALRVIDGLDFRVDEGELVGILGPNGAGKTTLFNLIAGVMPPSAGRILFGGRDITRIKVWDRCRLGIGRTYQIPKPFAHMTVFENALVAAMHGGRLGIGAAKNEAMRVLEAIGLAAHCRAPAGQLALLDLKRLELAKALAQRPRLLLLDEIAGGLTTAECDTLIEIIGTVRGSGVTIVWIEHVINALRRVATRLAVLHGGGILSSGTPDEVLADERVREVYLGAQGLLQ